MPVCGDGYEHNLHCRLPPAQHLAQLGCVLLIVACGTVSLSSALEKDQRPSFSLLCVFAFGHQSVTGLIFGRDILSDQKGAAGKIKVKGNDQICKCSEGSLSAS